MIKKILRSVFSKYCHYLHFMVLKYYLDAIFIWQVWIYLDRNLATWQQWLPDNSAEHAQNISSATDQTPAILHAGRQVKPNINKGEILNYIHKFSF